jgi:hypothetical protein
VQMKVKYPPRFPVVLLYPQILVLLPTAQAVTSIDTVVTTTHVCLHP